MGAVIEDENEAASASATTLASILGFALQVKRKDEGLSQASLSEQSGVSQATISRIEIGEADMTVSQTGALCAALNLRPAELFAAADKVQHELEAHNIKVRAVSRNAIANPKSLSAAAMAAGMIPIIGLNPIGWTIGSIVLNVLKKGGTIK